MTTNKGYEIEWTAGAPSESESDHAQAIADECSSEAEFRQRLQDAEGDWPKLTQRMIEGLFLHPRTSCDLSPVDNDGNPGR